MRLAGGRGKAKQGRLQGKTNSAEPRQSKPGSRAKSQGPWVPKVPKGSKMQKYMNKNNDIRREFYKKVLESYKNIWRSKLENIFLHKNTSEASIRKMGFPKK